MPDTRIVRFAPSPTGHLHIGGVRTALFNYLFVKNQGGNFILRIEDTDTSRSSSEMAEEIIEGLRWLGFHWDEGPYYQSQRFQEYRHAASKLLEDGSAYRCFCTAEEIQERRNLSEADGDEPTLYKYDRKCLQLTPDEIYRNLENNKPHVIRFRIPEGITYFKDRIHKEMKCRNEELEDFVILKSDDSPTYHLSVVVDDAEMGITDVVRGDDHISNTFKQILLFKALQLKPPKYAHLPLILGSDKKKLSKRHGETSVLEFKRQGYLPEALINYLSQLSWIPADTKKIFSLEELVSQFALSKLSKSSPVFDYEKLRFVNSRVIQKKSETDILLLLNQDEAFLKKYKHIPEDKKKSFIRLVKPRMRLLPEFKEKFDLYLEDNPSYTDEELKKLNENYPNDTIKKNLLLIIPALESLETFSSQTVETALRECADQNGLKAADFIHPTRFALTTETVSPSIFDVFEFLGKEKSIRRIRALIEHLSYG